MKQSRVKVVTLTSQGVGFYSYMIATVIPNTSESVDEVLVHVFFSVFSRRRFGLLYVLTSKQNYYEKTILLYSLGSAHEPHNTKIRSIFALINYKLDLYGNIIKRQCN